MLVVTAAGAESNRFTFVEFKIENGSEAAWPQLYQPLRHGRRIGVSAIASTTLDKREARENL